MATMHHILAIAFLTSTILCSHGQHNEQGKTTLPSTPVSGEDTADGRAATQLERHTINNHTFLFKVEELDSLEPDIVLTLYRGHKKILAHPICKQTGDCSSVNVELGTYKINGNKIVFYSYWAAADRQASPLMPFGFRKQTYEVANDGKLTLIEAVLYIEDFVEERDGNGIYFEKNGWKHRGVEFLNKTPRNSFENNALDDYIKNIEKQYDAKFVLGNERKALEKEIRQEMEKEIALYTGNWQEGEVYGHVKK